MLVSGSPSQTYRRKLSALSTNNAFNEQSEVFLHAAGTVTLVDRLVHRSEILELDGDSFRLKEATERAAQHSAKRKRKKTGA